MNKIYIKDYSEIIDETKSEIRGSTATAYSTKDGRILKIFDFSNGLNIKHFENLNEIQSASFFPPRELIFLKKIFTSYVADDAFGIKLTHDNRINDVLFNDYLAGFEQFGESIQDLTQDSWYCRDMAAYNINFFDKFKVYDLDLYYRTNQTYKNLMKNNHHLAMKALFRGLLPELSILFPILPEIASDYKIKVDDQQLDYIFRRLHYDLNVTNTVFDFYYIMSDLRYEVQDYIEREIVTINDLRKALKL